MKLSNNFFSLNFINIILSVTLIHSILLSQTEIFEFKDFGFKTDFDESSNIYFDEATEFNGGWPFYWEMDWYTPETKGGFVESNTQFWWVTEPDNFEGKITSRAIKFRHFGRFRIKASSFPSNQLLYLTIRYKDDVLPGSYPEGVPIFFWAGSKWQLLGQIEGKRDHFWKTKQFTFNSSDPSIIDGKYIFKIGEDRYTDSIIGELLLDKIKLSTISSIPEFEKDQKGLWPESNISNFSDLKNKLVFIPGESSFFPYGIYDYYWITDGGNATAAGYGNQDSWQILENAKMNCYVIHGWDQNWGSEWKTYSNEKPWASPGKYVELGLKEHIIQASAHNLKIIPNFLTDTRAFWIKKKYGNEYNTIKSLGEVMKEYGDNPNILMWYPVDEWDHEDDSYGKPHLFSHLLYNEALEKSPRRARFMLSMGFMGPWTWKLMSEDADVVGIDIYLSDYGGVEPGLKMQAKRLDEIRKSTDKPYIMVPEASKKTSKEEILAQAYMGIIHGASGIIFFRMHHPSDPELNNSYWDGLNQLGEELFGINGIYKILLPPSKILEINGENGIVNIENDNIHYILKLFDNKLYLIALNASKNTYRNVKITIQDLKINTPIRVQFEENNVIRSFQGYFLDDFKALERHIYQIGINLNQPNNPVNIKIFK